MSRIISIFFLLLIVFLFGTVFGMDRQSINNKPGDRTIENVPEDVIVYRSSIPLVEETFHPVDGKEQTDERKIETSSETEPKQSFIEKMATFLETGVKGFYNAIVDVLYSFSSLFV